MQVVREEAKIDHARKVIVRDRKRDDKDEAVSSLKAR